ncbi:hypothetical protein GCM10028895_31540 [Pontibacter rugosus]
MYALRYEFTYTEDAAVAALHWIFNPTRKSAVFKATTATDKAPMANYTFKGIFELLKDSGSEFMENNSLRLGAALAFNAIFSIPPATDYHKGGRLFFRRKSCIR